MKNKIIYLFVVSFIVILSIFFINSYSQALSKQDNIEKEIEMYKYQQECNQSENCPVHQGNCSQNESCIIYQQECNQSENCPVHQGNCSQNESCIIYQQECNQSEDCPLHQGSCKQNKCYDKRSYNNGCSQKNYYHHANKRHCN